MFQYAKFFIEPIVTTFSYGDANVKNQFYQYRWQPIPTFTHVHFYMNYFLCLDDVNKISYIMYNCCKATWMILVLIVAIHYHNRELKLESCNDCLYSTGLTPLVELTQLKMWKSLDFIETMIDLQSQLKVILETTTWVQVKWISDRNQLGLRLESRQSGLVVSAIETQLLPNQISPKNQIKSWE